MDRMSCDRMFVSVIELGSFTAAAQRLGVSSGQASKLVAKLESDLGVQLLVRSTRAVAPTEIGLSYYQRLRPLIEEFDALDASLRSASDRVQGRLRLSVPVSFSAQVLAPMLADFALLNPQVELEVAVTDRQVTLVDEGIDLALRIGPSRDTSLIARRLCPIRVICVASPAYLAARGTPQTPEDLAGHDCILDGNFADPHRWTFRDMPPLRVEGRISFAHAEGCVAAAESGLGLTMTPSFVAGPRIRAGHLTPVLTANEAPAIALSALYPAGRHLAAKQRALIDYLVQRFQGAPAWDQGWDQTSDQGG
jgi:DNA-binding transcriptional LysR family regulator